MNGSAPEEFLHWREVTIPLLIGHFMLVVLLLLFLNITVLLTLILAWEMRNPFSLIYGLILLVAIGNGCVTVPLECRSILRMVRFCNCSIHKAHIGVTSVIHHGLYPALLTSLAVLQLDIMKRKEISESYCTARYTVTALVVMSVCISGLIVGKSWMSLNESCLTACQPTNQQLKLVIHFRLLHHATAIVGELATCNGDYSNLLPMVVGPV